MKPPLEHLFKMRFDSDWTETMENELLEKVATRREDLLEDREILAELRRELERGER